MPDTHAERDVRVTALCYKMKARIRDKTKILTTHRPDLRLARPRNVVSSLELSKNALQVTCTVGTCAGSSLCNPGAGIFCL